MKEQFEKGNRIELIEMKDDYAPPKGTRGTIKGIDDMGHILMEWDNGSTLSLIPNEDQFLILNHTITSYCNNKR